MAELVVTTWLFLRACLLEQAQLPGLKLPTFLRCRGNWSLCLVKTLFSFQILGLYLSLYTSLEQLFEARLLQEAAWEQGRRCSLTTVSGTAGIKCWRTLPPPCEIVAVSLGDSCEEVLGTVARAPWISFSCPQLLVSSQFPLEDVIPKLPCSGAKILPLGMDLFYPVYPEKKCFLESTWWSTCLPSIRQ